MSLQWFKFYGSDWLSDLKLQDLSASERACFVGLLCLASLSDLPQNEIKDFTEERFFKVMQFSREDTQKLQGFTAHLEKLGMITLGNESVVIPRFTERQQKAMTGYERLKKYREKHKNTRKTQNDNTDNGSDNARIDKNRIEKNNNTVVTSTTGIKDEVNLIFNCFYETINPQINFARKDSRDAAQWLINKYGFENTLKAAKYACLIFAENYAPQIKTPAELKDKWANLVKFKDQQDKSPER